MTTKVPLGSAPRKSSFVEQPMQKILVGVAGGSAAGKTTLCENIYRQMAFDRNFKVEIIAMDSFYKPVDKTQVDITEYNFDHPNALDFELAYKTLRNLMNTNETVPIPQYSFIEHARMKEVTMVGPANIIFFEGLMAFHDQRIRDLMTYKIFINCDDDIRLCRRLKRDTTERGRSVTNVLMQYNKFVKNAFRDFILPTNVYADIIIPGFRNNRVSVDFIVQHIKNMAMRITFKERAIKTRTFIFGESELYDLDYSMSNSVTVTMQQQSFLVFPTSNQHKRQLQFFLTSLLSQIFSVQYFHQIYMNQFLKIIKSLFRQLVSFKNFDNRKMQLLSIYNIEEILRIKDDGYPIKVVFFPVAQLEYSKTILTKFKEYLSACPKTTFIILNVFCDMSVPNMIYRLHLSNVIMINLFVIANDKRFREIMTNNVSATTDSFDWFVHNHAIAEEGTKMLGKELGVYCRSEGEIAQACYDWEVSKGEKRKERFVDEQGERVQVQGVVVSQKNVFNQQHQNLCGFHALNTVMCLQKGEDILSRTIFIRNYHLLANCVGKLNYQPLERDQIDGLLDSKILEDHKNIGTLIYSFNYVQNSEEQLDQLQHLFDELRAEDLPYIYILLGVVDHYALLKVTTKSIVYYDSHNTSLRDIVNGTHLQRQLDPSLPLQGQKYTAYLKRMSNLKEAIHIVVDLLKGKRIIDVLVEKRIEDIVGSFSVISNDPVLVQGWLKNQYPKEVINNDLIKIMREKKTEISQKHRELLHAFLNHEAIKLILPLQQHQLY